MVSHGGLVLDPGTEFGPTLKAELKAEMRAEMMADKRVETGLNEGGEWDADLPLTRAFDNLFTSLLYFLDRFGPLFRALFLGPFEAFI